MKPTRIFDRYTLDLPDHLADWDVWQVWERERFDSILANVHAEDLLLDVGAEQGALSALYAKATRAAMCLIEPEPLAWRCIREIWEANELPRPLRMYAGLFGTDVDETPPDLNFDTGTVSGWPGCAFADDLCEARAYRYLHEHSHNTPRSTLDAWVEATRLTPTAITIDVEGAEGEVLKGAEKTLREFRPLVWLSVHPDLMARDYGTDTDTVFELIERHDYERRWLATDHEEHHFFHPKEREVS